MKLKFGSNLGRNNVLSVDKRRHEREFHAVASQLEQLESCQQVPFALLNTPDREPLQFTALVLSRVEHLRLTNHPAQLVVALEDYVSSV